MEQDWYVIENIAEIDSPALVIYKDRIAKNIELLINSIDRKDRLRPHIKTCKSPEVAAMMLKAGIQKFKCATIAEAEMLATAGAKDILLAYQPVGPRIKRLYDLGKKFPQSKFSCLIDNLNSAIELNAYFQSQQDQVDIYFDLNVGMNRTGIACTDALALFENCKTLSALNIIGLHAYDGHIRDEDLTERTRKCDEAFLPVFELQKKIEASYKKNLVIVAGGTPTYSVHKNRKEVECSPGTFIYWDKGYAQILQEQHYLFSALVISRVVSTPADDVICLDLGHKAIASENPLGNRVYFLNAPDLIPVGHSEEHMVFKTSVKYKVGDVLYGVPHHVCPTVALHEIAHVVEQQKVKDRWINISRKRRITI